MGTRENSATPVILPHSTQIYDANGVAVALNPPMTTKPDGTSVVGASGTIYDYGGWVWNVLNPTAGLKGDNSTDDSTKANALITVATNAGGGVIVFPQPPTTAYKMLATVTLKDKVHARGVGWGTSVLSFPTDLGTSAYAMDSIAGIQSLAPSLSDLQFKGPGTYTLGVSPSNMDGVNCSVNMSMRECYVQLFRSGAMFLNNHNPIYHCKFSNNYYGLNWGPVPASKGNQEIYSGLLDGNTYASIHVDGANLLDGVFIVGTHLGFGPHGLVKDDPLAGGTSTFGMMSESEGVGMYFEQIGNDAMLDRSTGSGGGADSLYRSEIRQVGYSTGFGSYNYATDATLWVVNIRNGNTSKIYGGTFPFVAGAQVGTTGVYNHTSGNGLQIEQPLGSVTTAAKLFGSVATWSGAGSVVFDGAYRARVWSVSGTITAGDIVAFSGGGNQILRYDGVRTICGVALTDGVNAGTAIVCEDGVCTVTSESVVNSGQFISPFPTTLHHGHCATNIGAPFSNAGVVEPYPIFGISAASGGAGGGGNLSILLTLGQASSRPLQPYKAPAPTTGQTAAVASVTALTSPNDSAKHIYQVSGTINITTHGTESINLQVTYTDDNGTARTLTLPIFTDAGTMATAANAAGEWTGSAVISVNPNTAITIKTAGTFTGATYNVSGQILPVL